MCDMTLKGLTKICTDGGFYRTPELNEVLYFHYKGFGNIREIGAYKKARCVWLEGNALEKVENLDELSDLRQLYLHENCIRKMEGFASLTQLVSLNLSSNFIECIEGIETLTSLKTLNVKHNRLVTLDSTRGLLACPSLETIDLTDNKLKEGEIVDEVLVKMPHLLSLYAHQNPFCSLIKPYRKTVLGKIRTLRYLDDRPVFPDERRTVDAWHGGGVEAEKTEREAIRTEEVARNQRNRDAFRELVLNAKREKAAMEAAGQTMPNTDFNTTNYGTPTDEDRWYTEERARNKARQADVLKMEKEMLLNSLRGGAEGAKLPKEGERASAPASTPPRAPAAQHADPTALPALADDSSEDSAQVSEAEAERDADNAEGTDAAAAEDVLEDVTSQVLVDYKEILSEVPPYCPQQHGSRTLDDELGCGGGTGDDAAVDDLAPQAESSSSGEPGYEADLPAAAPACAPLVEPQSPERRRANPPSRPVVWGTPAYAKLWEQAVAAGRALEQDDKESPQEGTAEEAEEACGSGPDIEDASDDDMEELD